MTIHIDDYETEFGTQPGYRSQYKSHVTITENNFLERTDWMLVRQKERDIAVPLDVISERAAIEAEAERLRTAMDEATTKEEIDEIFSSADWPSEE
jgi:hypothetical protein